MNASLSHVLLAGAGGFVGSAARFLLCAGVHRAVPLATFPYGTFLVNVIGCFAIGSLGGYTHARDVLGPAQRVFLIAGVLGGFTTFSTFAMETLGLAAADLGKALLNVSLQVVLGIAAAWAGYAWVVES